MAQVPIGLLARDLENTNGREDVLGWCQQLVQLIDDNIRAQNHEGYTFADTPVPQHVNVSGLSTADAQVCIYSELLELYSGSPDDPEPGKGFRNVELRVKSTPRGDEWEFHTEWNNMLSREEREAKLEIVKKYTRRIPYTGPTRPAARDQRARPQVARGGRDEYDQLRPMRENARAM